MSAEYVAASNRNHAGTHLDAVVLAGGYSRRMGQDKALMELEGQTLLQRVCGEVAACVQQTYVVTPWHDRYSPLQLPVQFVSESTDGDAPRGPLAGFACGLQAAEAEWVMLVACDLPLLRASSLRHGSEQLMALPLETTAFLCRHPKGWEPLCGFYRRRCLASVQAAIAVGTRSLQVWLADQAIAVWEDADPQLFVNCNSPADWIHVVSTIEQQQGQP